MFRRNVRGFPRLPESYQEVEYLQSTGTQYIDTGYKLSETSIAEIKASIADVYSNYGILGARTQNVIMTFSLFCYSSNYRYDIYNNSSKIGSYTLTNDTANVIIIRNGSCSVDGITDYTYSPAEIAFNCDYNAFVGAINTAGSATLPMVGKIYYCKFTDDSILVRSYIPCIRKIDSVAGMYDTVNGTFTENAGTGTFITGPTVGEYIPVPRAYQRVEYLESTGTQYIDTGIGFNHSTDDFKLDFECGLSGALNQNIFGAYNDATNNAGLFARSTEYWALRWDTTKQTTVALSSERLTVQSDRSAGIVTISGISTSVVDGPNSETGNIALFGTFSWPVGSITECPDPLKIYSYSVSRSGVYILSYIPCIRKIDSVAGMYDTVNGTFTENAGTGSFIAGPYVNAEAWTPAELSPLAWYKGEDNALDSIGSANGTWTGTEAYVDGKIGGAFDLSANQTTIGLSNCDFNFSGEASFTITAWVNGSYWSAMQTIISHYGHDINKRSWRFVISSGILTFESMSTGIYSSRDYVKGGDVLTGKWVHVAVSIDGLMATLYVDGLSSATGIIGSRFNTEKFVVTKIGAVGSSLDVIVEPFAAQIDDVLIFDKALTSTEITKIYNESVYRGGAAW